jgi:fatty-acyl-CoA synthase
MKTPDGYYKVTGRLKDMIIRGGENLYPREIEEFYLTNPKVRDVQVVGVPDERYGEECCAWVILHKGETADENEMKEFGNASIARHKVPRYFLFVNEFPMNAAGKILKYKMRDESVEILGLKK